MKVIATKQAPKAIGPYSQAIEANGIIYTSGQIALDENGILVAKDIENQTHQVMKNLFYLLEAGGSHFNDVIKCNIFLKNMEDFDRVNKIYAHYFGTHKPARSTIEVSRLPKDVLIEIDCIALANTEIHF
jgi:2-iminobutanoate/2-iminopropanoate deaminase